MLETCKVAQYPFTANQKVEKADWEQYVQEIANDILVEQSVRRLYAVSAPGLGSSARAQQAVCWHACRGWPTPDSASSCLCGLLCCVLPGQMSAANGCQQPTLGKGLRTGILLWCLLALTAGSFSLRPRLALLAACMPGGASHLHAQGCTLA